MNNEMTGEVPLSNSEKLCNLETMKHMGRVRNLLNEVIRILLERGEQHDQSKLLPPEVTAFAELTDNLTACTFGSPAYQEFLRQLAPALDHHYQHNRHHPQYHPQGVTDMTLEDLQEMLCDWKAASERHANGDIYQSISHNTQRFQISPQLSQIFINTAKAHQW